MTDGEKDSVAEAQAKVDAERERLANTVAEIRRRADPTAMIEDAKETAFARASDFTDSATRMANSGVATVRSKPEVAGAVAGGVGLLAVLYAWRRHRKAKSVKLRYAKLAERASVTDVLDPPAVNSFDTEYSPLVSAEAMQPTTEPEYYSSVQQETEYAQEQQSR